MEISGSTFQLAPKPKDGVFVRSDENRPVKAESYPHVRLEAAWHQLPKIEGVERSELDIDIYAVVLDRAGNLIEVIYHRCRISRDGTITLGPDNLTGEGDGADEALVVRKPFSDDKGAVHLYVTIHDAKVRGQNFGMATNSYVRLSDNQGYELAMVSLTSFPDDNAIKVAELRRSEGWAPEVKPIGGDFADFMSNYGIELPAAA